ncbi:MAG: hypothetical protein FWH18_01500 [Marinilabiliaceae bacterium]|nr:hypothetical protein [Marinilabiliaceae bacterium]
MKFSKNQIFNKIRTKKAKLILSFVLYLFVNTLSTAQMSLSSVNKEKLEYKKVIKYIKKLDSRYFYEIQPSINDSTDMSTFFFHNASFAINAPIDRVWNTCIYSSPSQLWKGKTIGLSFIYNKNSDNIFYHTDQQFDTLEINQIYFLNLLIIPTVNIAAALITTKIDPYEKVIEFTYIEQNKSIGKQILRLIPISDNETEIIHDTFYKSGSKFRDKKLYPIFHQKAITDLHKKIASGSLL